MDAARVGPIRRRAGRRAGPPRARRAGVAGAAALAARRPGAAERADAAADRSSARHPQRHRSPGRAHPRRGHRVRRRAPVPARRSRGTRELAREHAPRRDLGQRPASRAQCRRGTAARHLRGRSQRSAHAALDHAVRVACSLADAMLTARNRVGVVSLGGSTDWIAPGLGERARWVVVEHLLASTARWSDAERSLRWLPPSVLPHARSWSR